MANVEANKNGVKTSRVKLRALSKPGKARRNENKCEALVRDVINMARNSSTRLACLEHGRSGIRKGNLDHGQ